MKRMRGFLVPAGSGLPSPHPGDERKLKATGIDTGGAFMVAEYVLSHKIPLHVHVQQHESFYVLSGSLMINVGDDQFTAAVGDFVFLPTNVPHALAPIGDMSPELLVIATPNEHSGGVWPLPHGFPRTAHRGMGGMW